MIQYGLISETDARCIEKTIDLICNEFDEKEINVAEIGIFDGQSARGIYKYITDKEYAAYDIELMMDANHEYGCSYTAIDNEKDKPVLKPFPECNLIIGNSSEVYNQLEDNSQHMIIIDGNHSMPYTIMDFYCYESKVKRGGFICFHDIKPECQGLDWQRMGDEKDKDMSISVRKSLNKIGLLHEERVLTGWTKIFEEWDENDRCGGFAVFQKILIFD